MLSNQREWTWKLLFVAVRLLPTMFLRQLLGLWTFFLLQQLLSTISLSCSHLLIPTAHQLTSKLSWTLLTPNQQRLNLQTSICWATRTWHSSHNGQVSTTSTLEEAPSQIESAMQPSHSLCNALLVPRQWLLQMDSQAALRHSEALQLCNWLTRLKWPVFSRFQTQLDACLKSGESKTKTVLIFRFQIQSGVVLIWQPEPYQLTMLK